METCFHLVKGKVMFPSLFISHGAPNTVLKETISKNNLRNIQEDLGKLKYIVVISSHWTSSTLEMINPSSNELMYDFYGFEKELYEFKYDISSSQSISADICKKLKPLNIKVNEKRKSFDHGVWTVLYLLFEKINIPVIQLSLPIYYSTQELINLGKALRVLRDEALLVFSGSVTHNLYDIDPIINAKVKPYAKIFNEAVNKALVEGNRKVFDEYEKIPYFTNNHPTNEHFLPLLIALGSAKDYKAEIINQEMMYSNISMDSYMFKG